jgi:hypothetical protein
MAIPRTLIPPGVTRLALATVRRTPGISCEEVPVSNRGGAGMRRHLDESHTSLPCSRAAESFVSFIPLFDGAPAECACPLSVIRHHPTRNA